MTFVTIPFPRDRDFVNRGDIPDRIDKLYSESVARVALINPGGVGKPQMTAEYAPPGPAVGQPDMDV